MGTQNKFRGGHTTDHTVFPSKNGALIAIFTDSKELGRFLRFAVVGTIGAVIDFGLFNALTQASAFFHQNAVWASVISFIAAVTSNFVWNRYWTYPDSRSKPLAQQGAQFFMVSIIGLLIRTPLFAFLEPILIRFFQAWWKWAILSPIIVAHNVALAIVIGVVMLWNFFANRYWTYNDV
ncbi:MAG: GtrA family protein [Thermanaerothrix sp.]|uniref:GtrA family protein n=1 Tax=Thermanaerothrix sp. TaxID=2972675 RepID=UPI003C7A5021